MRNQLRIVLFAVVCSTVSADQQLPTKLQLVAAVDGKIFFAARVTEMTWGQAKAYCENLGWKLASVESERQHQALKAAYNSKEFFGGYWTAGRDAQLNRQFTWDGSNNVIPAASYFTSQPYPIEYQTCVLYASRPVNDSGIRYEICATRWGALCETG